MRTHWQRRMTRCISCCKAPYREQMRANMAEAMGVPVDAVGVKATTTEKLGFVGRKEGIAAWAVCLLQKD